MLGDQQEATSAFSAAPAGALALPERHGALMVDAPADPRPCRHRLDAWRPPAAVTPWILPARSRNRRCSRAVSPKAGRRLGEHRTGSRHCRCALLGERNHLHPSIGRVRPTLGESSPLDGFDEGCAPVDRLTAAGPGESPSPIHRLPRRHSV